MDILNFKNNTLTVLDIAEHVGSSQQYVIFKLHSSNNVFSMNIKMFEILIQNDFNETHEFLLPYTNYNNENELELPLGTYRNYKNEFYEVKSIVNGYIYIPNGREPEIHNFVYYSSLSGESKSYVLEYKSFVSEVSVDRPDNITNQLVAFKFWDSINSSKTSSQTNKVDCKLIANEVKSIVMQEVTSIINEGKRVPKLITFIVGSLGRSEVYVRNKSKVINNLNMESETNQLDENITREEFEDLISTYNKRDDVDGILIQMPLPEHLNADELINLIDPKKDVDGLTNYNLGRLFGGHDEESFLQPCTPMGVIKILEKTCDGLTGKDVLIAGGSNLLGKSLAQMLLNRDMVIHQTHSKSDKEMFEYLSSINPQVVCLCTGKTNLMGSHDISSKHNSPEIIIDCGIEMTEMGLRGDFVKEDYEILDNFFDTKYTSVPGGVGVLTTAMLAHNLLKCYKLNNI